MLTEKSPFYKRLTAFLIDLFIVLVTALFLDVLITKPCLNKFANYNFANSPLKEKVGN